MIDCPFVNLHSPPLHKPSSGPDQLCFLSQSLNAQGFHHHLLLQISGMYVSWLSPENMLMLKGKRHGKQNTPSIPKIVFPPHWVPEPWWPSAFPTSLLCLLGRREEPGEQTELDWLILGKVISLLKWERRWEVREYIYHLNLTTPYWLSLPIRLLHNLSSTCPNRTSNPNPHTHSLPQNAPPAFFSGPHFSKRKLLLL